MQERPERDALRDIVELASAGSNVLLAGERLGQMLVSLRNGRAGD